MELYMCSFGEWQAEAAYRGATEIFNHHSLFKIIVKGLLCMCNRPF